jgi:hypothetical protein
VIDYWDIFAGALLVIIGVYNLWLSRSSHFEINPFTVSLSRWLGGVGRARTLVLVAGGLCTLFGVLSIISGAAGAQ